MDITAVDITGKKLNKLEKEMKAKDDDINELKDFTRRVNAKSKSKIS